jgi:hypothetical protein
MMAMLRIVSFVVFDMLSPGVLCEGGAIYPENRPSANGKPHGWKRRARLALVSNCVCS